MLALAEKNNLKNASWYWMLRDLLINNHRHIFHIKNKSRALWLFRSVIQWCVVKTIYKNPTMNCEVIFHSIQYNLKYENGEYYDRLYMGSPIEGPNKTLFLVKMSPIFSSFKGFIEWYKKTKKLDSIQSQQVNYLDHYISLKDIFHIFIASLWLQYKFDLCRIFSINKNSFFIDGKDASKILIPLLKSSFYGDLQDAMVYSKSFERFLSSVAPRKKIITYGELMPGFRGIYYSGHKLGLGHQFITIQHALVGKNKLSSFYVASEFSDQQSRQGGIYSPMPDLYLVQGQQFSGVLGSYYPKDRIRVIGCLKYDNFEKKLDPLIAYRLKTNDLKSRLLVIAPSIGDFKEIKSVLSSGIDFSGWKIILSPHPVDRVQTINNFKSLKSLEGILMIEDKMPTTELVKYADIVLTGFSVVALEALFGRALPVRAINFRIPPQIDLDEGIPVITKPSELSAILKNFDQIKIDRNEIIAKYFYRLDGMASQRMWSEINASIS